MQVWPTKGQHATRSGLEWGMHWTLRGTWPRGTAVFIEGGAVWESFLDWVALELGPDR